MKEEDIITEYFKKMKGVRLTESSRARMENDLLSYVRFHAVKEDVRVGGASRSIEQVPQGTSRIAQLLTFKFTRMITTLLLIALMVGGSTSFAATQAVPGDFLYPVKVEFNENIEAALAVTNKSEAELQTKLIKERLEEAEELAIRGELDADTSAKISARLNKHYKNAEERSNKEAEKGNIETSGELRASLEGTLRSYVDVISKLNAEVKGNEGRALIADINVYANAQAYAQATATVDESVDIQADMEHMVARIDVLAREAQDMLNDAKPILDAKVYARIEAHVAEMVTAQAEAKAHLETKLYREAYQSAQKAIRLAHEVKVKTQSALRTNLKLDAEIDGIIDLNGTTTQEEVKEKNDDREEERDSKKDEGEKTDVDGRVEVDLDTSVDTDVIDTHVNTNTSVNANGRLGL